MKLQYIGSVTKFKNSRRVVSYASGNVVLDHGFCEVSGKLAEELKSREDYRIVDLPVEPKAVEPKATVKKKRATRKKSTSK